MDIESEQFGDEDFVFYKNENEIIGGGYKINSFFLQEGISPLTTINNENYQQDGGKVSTPFENLAVPAGLFYINQRIPKHNKNDDKNESKEKEHYYKQHETLSDDMIDKLLGLVEVDKKKKRQTRKHTNKSNINVATNKRKSRKHK